ncbi:MAG: hypothetical protein ACI4PV_00625 [Butyricicoccus sp.]
MKKIERMANPRAAARMQSVKTRDMRVGFYTNRRQVPTEGRRAACGILAQNCSFARISERRNGL